MSSAQIAASSRCRSVHAVTSRTLTSAPALASDRHKTRTLSAPYLGMPCPAIPLPHPARPGLTPPHLTGPRPAVLTHRSRAVERAAAVVPSRDRERRVDACPLVDGSP